MDASGWLLPNMLHIRAMKVAQQWHICMHTLTHLEGLVFVLCQNDPRNRRWRSVGTQLDERVRQYDGQRSVDTHVATANQKASTMFSTTCAGI